MTEPTADPRLTYASVDRAMTGLEALADQWAVEIDLPGSPMHLKNATAEVREGFIAGMAEQIDAIVRLAFIEGAYRGTTGAFDAVRAGYDPTHNANGEQAERPEAQKGET